MNLIPHPARPVSGADRLSIQTGLRHLRRGLVLNICLWSMGHAATYYVAPNGNDSNAGTFVSPFATLQKAHDVAKPGDGICLRGGRYQWGIGQVLTRSGTKGQPITVFAYPGETPVIDAGNMTRVGYVDGFPIALDDASWWHIKGLEIKNGPSGGMVLYGNATSNIIENNNVHHNGRLDVHEGKGIVAIGTGSNNLFLNNDSHHNRDASVTGENADGFASSLSGANNVFRGNRAWRNSDDGFDFFNAVDHAVDSAHLVDNNWAWENGYDDSLNPLGNGTGFKLGGRRRNTSGSSGGHKVVRNLSWRNRGHGFAENSGNGGVRPMTMLNNTAWNNAGDNYLFANTTSTFHNNIDHVNGQGRHINPSSNVTHNSWTLPVAVKNDSFASLDYSAASAARHPGGSLPAINFLRPATGADIIDKGMDVGIPFSGSAPDLGAYEFVQ